MNKIKTALTRLIVSSGRLVSPLLWETSPAQLPFARRGRYTVKSTELSLTCPRRPQRKLRASIWFPNANDVTHSPLILYSHFLTGWRKAPPFICEHLASYGYIVAAVDHCDPYPDWKMLVDRPLDILALLHHVETDNYWQERINFQRIGVAGYSMGGTTAVMLGGARIHPSYYLHWCAQPQPLTMRGRDMKRFARWWDDLSAYASTFENVEMPLWQPFTDSRIGAVFAMAPWGAPLFGEEGLASVTVPTFIIGGTSDQNAVYERDQDFMFRHIATDERMLLSVQNAGHTMVYVPGMQDILSHYAVGFFEACFKQEERFRQQLMNTHMLSRLVLETKH